MGNYRKLFVWEEAMGLAEDIYKITSTGKLANDFGLKNQLQRAAVSVPSNIAEGDELGTNKNGIRHFYIAKGSAAEVVTQILLAKRIGYLDERIANPVIEKGSKIGAMLNKLIKARGG